METPSINPEVDLFIVPFNLNPILCICVRFISLSAPKFNTDSSDNNDKSSPTFISAPTPKPPATVKAPSVAIEDSVVAEIATTPAADILIASVSLEEPIVPASGIIRLVSNVTVLLDILIALVSLTQPIVPESGITIFVPNVEVEAVIANSSAPAILILTCSPAYRFKWFSSSQLI